MTLDERIARLRQQRMAHDSIRGIDSTLSIRREASLNEKNAVYHKRGHFLYFCVHDKSKFLPCVACKRTQRDGELNYEAFAELLGDA